MIVRQLRDVDAEDVSEMIIANLKEVNAQYYSADIINRMVSYYTPEKIIETASQRMFLVAEQFDELVGTATINDNFFGSVFVKISYHSKGIGRKLIQSLEKLAQKTGMTEVTLHSSVNAVHFYEKLGYAKGKEVEDEKFGASFRMTKIFSK